MPVHNTRFSGLDASQHGDPIRASRRRQQRGFTLVEMMVVVVIISIISAIAIPSYRSYVMKANRTQARSTLVIAAQTLEKCYTDTGAYNDADCPNDAALSSGGNNPDGHYTISSVRTASNYTLTAQAAGSQTDDTECAKFTISSAGAKVSYTSGNTANTYGACW